MKTHLDKLKICTQMMQLSTVDPVSTAQPKHELQPLKLKDTESKLST